MTVIPGDDERASARQIGHIGDDSYTREVIVLVGDASPEQQIQDEAVRQALGRLVLSRLPRDRALDVILCEHPEELDISLEQMADVELRAFIASGYGHRAEGPDHFNRVFRGYKIHGALRYMILAERDADGRRHALTWGNYFQVYDDYAGLDQDYANSGEGIAAALRAWRRDHPGLEPDQYIGSKFVTDPAQPPVAVGLAGPAGLLLKAALLGLAAIKKGGMTIAARTQYDSQRLIRGVLPILVPGIHLLLDHELEGEGPGGMQSLMLAHVPNPGNEEK